MSTEKENFQKKDTDGKKDFGKGNRYSGKKHGGKRNPGGGRRDDAPPETKFTDISSPKNCNDIDWYVHDKTEAQQIGSISFSYAMGVPAYVSGKSFNPAGLCVLEATPMYGTSSGPNSAMNQGIRKNFADTRKANSGSANYTATFEGMYMLGFDSIYYLMSHIRRAFSIFHTYSTWNRYYPKGMLQALGFDFDDIANNFPQYVAKYNNLIRAISIWNIPDRWPIFKRHSYLFGAGFVDSNDPKDQVYFYKPTGYYVFKEINTEETAVGSVLEWKRLSISGSYGDSMTIDEWFACVEECLASYISSSTAQILNGDIAKAFGDATYKVSLITGEETLTLIDDDMACEQIMNATPVGVISNLNVTEALSGDVNEDIYLVVTPQVTNRQTEYNTDSFLLSSYMDPVTPEAVIELSRLMVPIDYDPNLSEATPVDITGPIADAIEFAVLITLDDAEEGSLKTHSYSYVESSSYPENGNVSDVWDTMVYDADLVRLWNYFDYAPRYIKSIKELYAGTNDVKNYNESIQVKLSNYSSLSRDTLERINNIAIQRLFGF